MTAWTYTRVPFGAGIAELVQDLIRPARSDNPAVGTAINGIDNHVYAPAHYPAP